MAADGQVDINLEVKGWRKAIAEIKAVDKALNGLGSGQSSRLEEIARDNDSFNRSILKMKKSFDSFDKGVKLMGTGLTKFLGLAIKGTLLQMALLSAAILSIHGLFVIGQGIMKAYRGTMNLVGGAAGGLAVALTTVAAAIREQQAAMFAFSKGSSREYGSATNQVRIAMRSLQMDADLAGLGVENLNKAYGAMAKSMNSNQIAGSKNIIKALFDFGAAGQDPGAAAEKIGEVVAALSDTKKTFGDVQKAAKTLGPQMEKAMKELGITSKKKFQEALLSGDLAKKGGVFGQFAEVNNTLIGRVKTFFNLLRGEFADFGLQFLEPAKVAMQKIFRIIRRDLSRVSVELGRFGAGSFMDGLVNVVDKISSFFVKVVREYLPKATGTLGRIGDWMSDFKRGWNIVLERLRKFTEGARVLEKAFSPIWKAIKEGGVDAMNNFNRRLVENAAEVRELGERVGGLIKGLMDFGSQFREIFFQALPFVNDVLKGITDAFHTLKSLLGSFTGMFGGTAGLMMFSIIARQMKNTSGGLLPAGNVNSMNVNAGSVNINGAPVGGPQRPSNVPPGPPPGAGGGGGGPAYPRIPAAGGPGTMPANGGGVSSGAAPMTYAQAQRLSLSDRGGLGATEYMNRHNAGLSSGPAGGASGALAAGPLQKVKFDQWRRIVAPNSLPLRQRMQISMDAIRNRDLPALLRNRRESINQTKEGFRTHNAMMNLPALGPSGYAYAGRHMQDIVDTNGDVVGQKAVYMDKQGNIRDYDRGIRSRMQRAREIRAGMRGARILGNKEAGIEGTNQRISSKIGVGIGLSMMSQYAPEEMRGAMALGGMVGQFNPLAGLGIAGLGGALKARSAVMGGLSGAAGGAAIGTMIAPGVGTAVGAALGGLSGAIMGAARKYSQQLKEAKVAMTSAITSMGAAVVSAANRQLEENARLLAEKGPRGFRDTGKNVGALENMADTYSTRGGMAKGEADRAMALGSTKRALGIGGGGGNYKAKMIAGGLGGAAAGAYIGGSIGMIGTPVGAAVGAALGAALGGFVGAATGAVAGVIDWGIGKLFKDDKKAKAQRKALDQIYARQDELGMVITEEQLKQMKKQPEAALEKLQQQFETEASVLNKMDAVYSDRLDELERISGKSRPEIELLAKELGVNLYDSTIKFTDVLQKLGLATIKTAEQMRMANVDILAGSMGILETEIKKEQAAASINERAAGFAADMKGGKVTKQQRLEFLQGNLQDAQALFGSGVIGFYEQTEQIGTREKPGPAFQKGGVFEGISPDQFFGKAGAKDDVSPIMTSMRQKTMSDFTSNAATQISSMFTKKGLSTDVSAIQSQISGMSDEEIKALLVSMEDGTFGTGAGMNRKRTSYDTIIEDEIKRVTGGEGFDIATQTMPMDKLDAVATGLKDGSTEFVDAVKKFKLMTDEMFKNPMMDGPEWLKTPPVWWNDPSDTSSPRGSAIGDSTSSRLGMTMARHASINSQLTGKRTITSSYRTFALGSPSSDHLTGRAIDLVGANLGQYKKLTEESGGFAEFHGRGGSRHLHVVPGPGAIGDSPVPVMARPMSSTSSSSRQAGPSSYVFNINGGNQSPEEIANRVIMKIREIERTNKERM